MTAQPREPDIGAIVIHGRARAPWRRWRPRRTQCRQCLYGDSLHVIGKVDYCALTGETFMDRTGCHFGVAPCPLPLRR